jgi:mannan endo-1,4-beta-mannosidase
MMVRFWVLACLFFLGFLQQTAARGSGFVKTAGTHFSVNGKPLFVNGFNSYWLMTVATDLTQRNKVTSVFEQAAAHRLNVARTWAFNDGQYKALQTFPGVYDEQVFQALDFVVFQANKYGLRLILSLANNYVNFGGKAQYVQWARNAGQNLNSDDDFFTNPTVKGYYKNHVKTVLTRVNSITGVAYKDDPTIFAWELMNEPRCQSDPSGRTIQGWIEEMATHVKSIDGNHLLEAGLEGFYGEYKKEINPGFSVGTDFITNNQITGLDFATVHSYPDIWLAGSDEEAQLSFLQSWIESHLEDGRRILKKPVLFTEFGKSYRDPGFGTGERDNLLDMVYKHVYASARWGGAGGGAMFWQLMAEGMSSYGDGYEIVLSQNPSTAALVSGQSHKLAELTHLFTRMYEKRRLVHAHRS